jgi:2-polyprenyl-3-methyl-5-hydroxy-6-metoxy-1,4-benzoquinol methylase
MSRKKTDPSTARDQYTKRLLHKQEARWKRLFNVQVPYRWNLQRLQPGFILDIGCGIGRNLINLKGDGVGVDHNDYSVELAEKRGVRAYTPEKFWQSEFATSATFDSLLFSHVAEHMTVTQVTELL